MNNYNDFQIPDTTTFQLINEALNQEINKKINLSKLLELITTSINSCFSIDVKINSKIRQAIINTKKELVTLHENLTLIFKTNNIYSTDKIKRFNVFTFIQDLIYITKELSILSTQLTNTSHKRMVDNSTITTLNSAISILSTLSSSTISLYRYL